MAANGTVVIHEMPKSDINTTPLVDVMLVLLIIFMITAPLVSHKVDAQIPQPGQPQIDPTQPIQVRISMAGVLRQFYLDDQMTDLDGLRIAFRQEGRKRPEDQATFKLAADDSVPYEQITQLIAGAQQAGVRQFGFADL